MRKIGTAFTAVALALAASSAPAAAQINVSLGGGPSFPVGDLGDVADMGFNGLIGAEVVVPMVPFGVRIDGMINQFGFTDVEDVDLRVLSGTVNAMLRIPMVAASPYLIGGIGVYNSDMGDVGDLDIPSETDLGANIGIGVRFGLSGLAVFGEARMHNIFTDGESIRFIPVTLGLSL